MADLLPIESYLGELDKIKEQWAEFLQGYGIAVSADNKISSEWVEKFKGVIRAFFDISKTTFTSDIIDNHIAGFRFLNDRALKTVSLPNCTGISGGMFEGCTSLQSVNIPKVKNLGSSISSYEAVISEGRGVFRSCIALPSISLPLCETIGSNAFARCSALTIVDCPNIRWIGAYSNSTYHSGEFSSCTSLITVTGKPTRVGNKAFYNCKSLKNIDLSNISSEPIGTRAFYECSALESVNLERAVKILEDAFYNAGLKTINAPKLENIGNNAFYQTQHSLGLESVNFPECIKLGESVFYQNERLTEVNLPKLSGELPTKTFRNCYLLTQVNIPLITSYATEAFSYCESLEHLDFSNIIQLGSNVFTGCKKMVEFDLPEVTTITGTPFYSVGAKIKYIKMPKLISYSSYIINSSDVEYALFGIESSSALLVSSGSIKKIYLPNYSGDNLTIVSSNTKKLEQVIYGDKLTILKPTMIQLAKKVKVGLGITSLTNALQTSTSATYRTHISLDFENLQNVTCTTTFNNMSNLRVIIFRGSQKVEFSSNYNAQFGNCYFMLGTTNSTYNPNGELGYFYVKDELVEEYKADSFFAGHENQILPLSQLPSEYDITGEYIEGEFDLTA